MRPATPNFNFAQQAGPSSPPQTPTTASAYAFGKNRRHGMHFPPIIPHLQNGNIIPNGQGTTFSYIPSARPADLSPRSSSPDSSLQSSTSNSPPRSLASSPGHEPLSSSSPPPRHSRVVIDASFTVEEFRESDYEEFESDDESVIRPHQYEDAESDRAHSVKSLPRSELPQRLYTRFREMNCQPEEQEQEQDTPDLELHNTYVKQKREEKRKKRRSSSSVQKRTFSQSIGSDTDEEDIQPVFEGANEAGSSARRLRRKGENDRTSLIFDDPPPRIEELEEPESCEEVVEVRPGEEDYEYEEGQGVDRNLPYYRYVQEEMDIDSDED